MTADVEIRQRGEPRFHERRQIGLGVVRHARVFNQRRPDARVLIIGGSEVSYGRTASDTGGYRGQMEREVGDRMDWSRVHFLGRIPYDVYCQVIQLSRCHVYLTVPFVLSWSLLEAMAMNATVVASTIS